MSFIQNFADWMKSMMPVWHDAQAEYLKAAIAESSERQREFGILGELVDGAARLCEKSKQVLQDAMPTRWRDESPRGRAMLGLALLALGVNAPEPR